MSIKFRAGGIVAVLSAAMLLVFSTMVFAQDVPQGGTVVLMGHQEVAGLSPDDSGPTVQFVMITNIHNALVELDENFEFENVLAESVDISEDGLTYTFNLREGVLFHDGEEFTAEDVVYTSEFYGNPDNGSVQANDYASVVSVEAVDDYTVAFTLEQPNAAFMTFTATNFIVPAHYHSEVGEEVYRTAPIGTGAFKLKEWRATEFTELEAFDDHFRGRPNIDILRLDVVPEPSVRAIALTTGDADSSVWPLLVENSLQFADDPSFNVFRTSASAVNHFPLNNTNPVLAEKAVRQAMMYAINRQQVIDDIFSGAAVVAQSNLSPAFAFYANPDVKTYEYDVDQAMALLDEAGWVLGDDGVRVKDDLRLSFTCTVITGDQARRPEAEVVQQYLGEVGIEMILEEAPVASILEGMRAGTMDCSLFNWTYGSSDPDATVNLATGGGNNFSQYSNARVDELLVAGLAETDLEARQAIYYEIQEIVAEEVPFIYMMYWDGFSVFSGRVQGLPESATNGDRIYRTAHEWWVEG